jgi:hypothetical protein
MAKKLPPSIQPRGFSIDQAAEYAGICASAYKKLMKLGVMPGPINIAGFDRSIIDRVALDAALSRAASNERKSA